MAIKKTDEYLKAATGSETLSNARASTYTYAPKKDNITQVVSPAVVQTSSPAAASNAAPAAVTTAVTQAPVSNTAKSYSYSGVRPEYTSPYSTQIDQLLNAVMSREDFSYDLESDPLYDQYRKQYTREGDRAMRDTMGNAAALTGGYGSSYASTAGSQAYDYYLSQLNDRIPELEQLAYQKYLQEGQDLYDQLAALQSLEQDAYGKYRDSVSDFESDRAFDYGVYSDDLAQQNWQTSFDYQKAQDALAQQNWEKEFAYQQEQDALAYALKLAKQQSDLPRDPDPDPDPDPDGSAPSPVFIYNPTDSDYNSIVNTIRNAVQQNGATAGEVASYLMTQWSAGRLTDTQVTQLAKQFGAGAAMSELLE